MRIRQSVLLFLAFSGAATVSAAAQEYCVACTEPAALYRCVVDGARPGAAPSLQVLCLTALAKEGAHGTCAVRRDIGVIDCTGVIKHVAVPAAPVGAAVVAAPTAIANVPSPNDPMPEPKTVEELLKQAKAQSDRSWEKTSEQIKANNDKVGTFFKKSWGCVASLFTKCSGE